MNNLTGLKVGVYVDSSNMYSNGGQGMRYDVLRKFASRGGSQILRLNAYVSIDLIRGKDDKEYLYNAKKFHSVIRDLGYKVIETEVKWYEDEDGQRYGKANADVELVVDILLQAENLDKIILVSGDGDFTKVIKAVQNKGCRVEVIALNNASQDLRKEADLFISGFLIPGLIPTKENSLRKKWGEIGSRVRGVCFTHKQNYGFMRYINDVTVELWQTNTTIPGASYSTAYFKDSNLPFQVDISKLPSHNYIFEFELIEGKNETQVFEAIDIDLVSWIPS